MDELNIRMLARDEALLAAEPSGAASSESASSIAEGASKVQAVHTGLRSRDTFRWVHSGSGAVAIKNVFVEFDGVVTGYADGAVTVTGTKYVYAEVVFTMSGSKATGITSVTISAADAFGDAAKKVLGEDGEVKGVRLPIYKLQKLSSADVVVCHEDYVHGVPSASVPDQWLTDADSDANLTRCSLSRDTYSVDGVADPSKPDVLGLYDFENPTDGQFIKHADSADWPSSSPDTFRKKQLLLVRSVEGETGGLVNLRYCLHNPMPSGGGAGEAAKWDATKGGWVSVPLKATENDETGAALAFGDRVVTGIKAAVDGDDFLLQLETRALPAEPEAPTIPDISIPAATDGGSGGDTITYVSGMAVDATNKHQINVTVKSKAIAAGIPDGTTTNDLLRWNGTAWVSVPLKASANDETGAALAFGDRVVTGIKVSADGSDFILQLETRALPAEPDIPMDGISLENNADGKQQIMEWDGKENTTGNGISQILKADPESGELSAFGDSGRYELLCRVGGPGGPVGYMPIGEGDGSDPEDPNAEKCDQNQHPASGVGGGGEEGEDHPADEDNEHPGEDDNGTGGDTGDAQHPASDDCYTTAY